MIDTVPASERERPEELTDSELACRAQAGAVSCFEELARRHQTALLQFLQSRCGCRAQAEDILQEAFLKAFVNLSSFQRTQSFRAWLFTIAYHQMIQQHRSDATRRRLLREYAQPEFSPRRENAAGTEGPGELWAAARAALSDEQFSALWLFHVEELPLKEIARIVGRNPITVRVLLYRARKKLQSTLAQAPAAKVGAAPAPAAPAIRAGASMEGSL